MLVLDDTIAAISTPVGQGGIGIVRLSGAQSLAIARRIFKPHGHPRGLGKRVQPQRLYYGHILALENGRVVDEVLLTYMRAPHTYTRQDVVEINAHGGWVPLREILSLCLAAGARLAREGEFTLRAFLNGRIDLAQAEAVADIINARTTAALRVAQEQLQGQLSQRVRALRSRLLDVLASLEASIDFPDEDLAAHPITSALQQVAAGLAELLLEAERGLIYRQGLRVAIVGRPNVGKSSLLNALLRTERAIVTPIPGTTRDTLEETLNLRGIPLVLVDTAGISASGDPIERLGIARSRSSAERADLLLMVADGSQAPSIEDLQVAELAQGKTAILVLNKSDLSPAGLDAGKYAPLLPAAPRMAVSALTGTGLPELETLIWETVCSGQVSTSHEPLVSNPRHHALLQQAQSHIAEALTALTQALPPDLLAIDVTEALHALGEVTGETAHADLLERIFANFCIGK